MFDFKSLHMVVSFLLGVFMITGFVIGLVVGYFIWG